MKKKLIITAAIFATLWGGNNYMKSSAAENLVIGSFKSGLLAEMKADSDREIDIIEWRLDQVGKQTWIEAKAEISYKDSGKSYCKIVDLRDTGRFGTQPDSFKVIGDCS